MKNQSGTIKTNLELYRVVKGGSGGYRRLPGGSAHFSLHTNRQTLHHNIYIIIITITITITINIDFTPREASPRCPLGALDLVMSCQQLLINRLKLRR